MGNIYALLMGAPDQRAIIDDHCFGTCGKIIIGAIHDEAFGELAVCRTPAGECPQFASEGTGPFAEVSGEPVYARTLKG